MKDELEFQLLRLGMPVAGDESRFLAVTATDSSDPTDDQEDDGGDDGGDGSDDGGDSTN